MFAHVSWGLFALGCATTVAAQDNSTLYQFTMSVTSPAPVPGQPFTLTWTGGEPDEAVYIVFNGYFPDTPDQNIIYITTDILCRSLPDFGRGTDRFQQMRRTTGPGLGMYLSILMQDVIRSVLGTIL